MMSIKKISLLALLAVTSVGGLASCNNEPGESNSGGNDGGDGNHELGTIVISGPAEAEEFTIEKANEWAQKEGLDYGFQFSNIGEDVIDTDVADWTATGAPDIFMFSNDKVQSMVPMNAMTAVTPENLQTMLEDYQIPQSYFDTLEYGDDFYGYPFTLNGYCYWYNKDKVETYTAASDFTEKTGITDKDYTKWTMSQWLKVAQVYSQKITYPLVTPYYGAAALTTYGAGWEVEFNRQGKIVNITTDFNSDEGYWAAENLRAWHQDFGGALIDSDGTQQPPTNSSNVLGCVNGAWALADSSSSGGETAYAEDSIQCMTIPDMSYTDSEGEEHRAHTNAFNGSKAFGVNPSKSLGDPDRMFDLHSLCLYLVSPEVQRQRYELNSSWLPTSDTVAHEITDSKCAAALAEQLSYGVAQSNLPPQIWYAPASFVQNFIDNANGDKMAEDAIKTLLQQLDTSLKSTSTEDPNKPAEGDGEGEGE